MKLKYNELLLIFALNFNLRPYAMAPSEVFNNMHLLARHFTRGRQEDAHELLRLVSPQILPVCSYCTSQPLSLPHATRAAALGQSTNPLIQIVFSYFLPLTSLTCDSLLSLSQTLEAMDNSCLRNCGRPLVGGEGSAPGPQRRLPPTVVERIFQGKFQNQAGGLLRTSTRTTLNLLLLPRESV